MIRPHLQGPQMLRIRPGPSKSSKWMESTTRPPTVAASPSWKPSPSSAPHLPHELPSLTLYGPSLRTYQGPIYHLGKAADEQQGRKSPAPRPLLSRWVCAMHVPQQSDTKAPVPQSVWPLPCAKSFISKNLA